MRLVVDSNIAIAALLRDGQTRRLLFSDKMELVSTFDVRLEVLGHKPEFMEKSGLDENAFDDSLEGLLKRLLLVPLSVYGHFEKTAVEICPLGHENDWPFLALALQQKCGLWTNDTALKKQPAVPVYSTRDLLALNF